MATFENLSEGLKLIYLADVVGFFLFIISRFWNSGVLYLYLHVDTFAGIGSLGECLHSWGFVGVGVPVGYVIPARGQGRWKILPRERGRG
jgi:hypothetical protein